MGQEKWLKYDWSSALIFLNMWLGAGLYIRGCPVGSKALVPGDTVLGSLYREADYNDFNVIILFLIKASL